MPENQSYFHRINNELTVNLAEVSAVFDHTSHIQSLAASPNHQEWAAKQLETGQTCLFSIRPARSPMSELSGREFRITRAEMTTLQDALEWYNRTFTDAAKK